MNRGVYYCFGGPKIPVRSLLLIYHFKKPGRPPLITQMYHTAAVNKGVRILAVTCVFSHRDEITPMLLRCIELFIADLEILAIIGLVKSINILSPVIHN